MKKAILFVHCLVVLYITLNHAQATTATLFSPGDKPTTTLLELIKGAQKTIRAAVYMFTDKTIAQALINAKKARNIDIKVILDQISSDSKYGKADMLAQNGINVFIFDPHKTKKSPQEISDNKWFSDNPIMHNKFIVIDETMVWTGSFNWTVAANTRNCENVIYTNDREACKRFSQYFTNLLSCCRIHTPVNNKNKSQSSLRESIQAALIGTGNDHDLLEKLYQLLEQHTLRAQGD